MSDLKSVQSRLAAALPRLSMQLRRAGRHLLEYPEDVAIKSMRRLAHDADVSPSTMVRLAKAVGFDSYDALREVFQDAIRSAGSEYASRAEWLQQLPKGGRANEVVGTMAETTLANVETMFRGLATKDLSQAAEIIRRARTVQVVGVGGMHAIALYFYYVARIILPNVRLAMPATGRIVDDLVDLDSQDVVVTSAFSPYASETVRAVEFAARQEAKIIALTDSRAAPIAPHADVVLLVPSSTPQVFPSQVATIAMMETLLALIVSRGEAAVISRIKKVDGLRRQEGVYWQMGTERGGAKR